MFGTNNQAKRDHGDGKTLEVKEIFSTIQGEGPFSGVPAIFVRLAGCHLKCYFCDTNFENGTKKYVSTDIIPEIALKALTGKRYATALVVITGGEPLRQNILPLCKELAALEFTVQIETSGTYWVDGLENLVLTGAVQIVCSPKTGTVNPMIELYCRYWKYLIREGENSEIDGLPIWSTQVAGQKQELYRPKFTGLRDTIWLQPCEAYQIEPLQERLESGLPYDQYVTNSMKDEQQTLRNMKEAARIAMEFNYRLTLQTHKLLGLP